MTPRLPPPVQPGDRVGVAALSGPVDPVRLEAGLESLAGLGFEPVLAANLGSRHDLFAGSDDERLQGLDDLLADESIGAIFFARGGHGMMRLLPRLDWDRVARRPRAWIGYSDLTPLLNLIVERLGWVAFHGPMVAVELADGLSDTESASLMRSLAGDLPIRFAASSSRAQQGSTARGLLRGGCLSLLCALLGTPWAATLAGSILALEDVGEPTYRIDRMLTHLTLSGSLTGVRGVVLGGLCGTDEAEVGASSMAERVSSFFPGLPVLEGIEFGHGRPQLTLPLGLPASIDMASQTLTLDPPRDPR